MIELIFTIKYLCLLVIDRIAVNSIFRARRGRTDVTSNIQILPVPQERAEAEAAYPLARQ